MPSNLGRWKPTRSYVGVESRYWPCRIRLWFSEWVEVRCLPWHYDLQFSFGHINGTFFWKFCLQQSWMGRFQDNCCQRIPQSLDKRDFYWVDLCVQLKEEGEEHVFCPGADFRAAKRTPTNLVLSWKHPLCDWKFIHAVVYNKEERLARLWHNVGL